MRLLHFDSDGRLVLTNFSGRTVPPYAILSHRWDSNNEVLFEDVGNNTYKRKTGFQKIEFCAKQAARDQLNYFWIDTCCIDKWNRHVSIPSATDVHEQSIWEASFRASKWFTRGWTLQELIAPASVEFFSSEGWRLGNKKSMEQQINEITGIPIQALQGCPLENFSRSDRMAWARQRETTEQEDGAYCLLGIFGLRMLLTYGEGKDKAFSRLQEELEATIAGPSIIPFSRNDRFVGRECELAELEARLFGAKRAANIAILGEGGVGKSQLALEFAHRKRQEDANCSVFWIPASDVDSMHLAYTHIAQKLSIPGWDDEKADILKLVKIYLSGMSAGRWLLIYDNADDIRLGSNELLATSQATSLIDHLPQSELGSIIFTTTDSKTAETLASTNVIKLLSMTPDTAKTMLENYLSNLAGTSQQQEVTDLLEQLSYLPLAIVQAAAYMNISKKTVKAYLSLMAAQNVELVSLLSEESKDKLQHSGRNNPVTITWLISLERIRRGSPLAAEYLFLMAGIDRKDIPLDFLSTISSSESGAAVEILNKYALITKRPAESALDLHRLVHLNMRKWLQTQKWLDEWNYKAVLRLLQVFPDPNPGSRSRWRRLLPHARYALSQGVAKEDEARMRLAWKYAIALHSDGRYSEAEKPFEELFEANNKALSKENPDQETLTSMAWLASTYRNQGRWKEAEELGVRVMETSRWKEAEKLEVRVMETRKRVLGEEHPSTLTSMANLAITWKSCGRDMDALELITKCQGLLFRRLGGSHPNTISCSRTVRSWSAK
ncbi:kinesin light chain 1 [Tothia fuscella]|uniref:Kinesin light chain 1 n=1 Tax=Tothia fuscella TaxID=1048955 RepID=A0A9P4U1L5_9PEZI|nr:kinesin light chain 1 [Tothia fuscella]